MFCYIEIVFFVRNIFIIYIHIFIIGLLSGWRLYLGYIYGSEIVKESSLNMAGSIFNLFDAQVVIFASLFLEHVSNDWIHLHSIYIFLVFISFCISLFMPESPKFLVSKKDYIGATIRYNFIARFNGKENFRLDRENIRFIEEKSTDKRRLKILFKKLAREQNQGFQNNIKASLAA